jgi:DNA-binding IclR family transcriptional regulator
MRTLLAPQGPAVADRTAEVLRLLGERGRLTARELAAALGCSRPVVGKILTVLVSEGRVRALAEGRSPFQAYALASA